MTDRELRKLSRKELMLMLLQQSKEMQVLRTKLAATEAELRDKQLKIEKAGSIAEASMQLNGVFEAAQAACQQYLLNMERLNRQQQERCAQMEQHTLNQCKEMLEQAEQKIRPGNGNFEQENGEQPEKVDLNDSEL